MIECFSEIQKDPESAIADLAPDRYTIEGFLRNSRSVGLTGTAVHDYGMARS